MRTNSTENNRGGIGSLIMFMVMFGLGLALVGAAIGAFWYILPFNTPEEEFQRKYAPTSYDQQKVERQITKRRMDAAMKDTSASMKSRAKIGGAIGAVLGILLAIPFYINFRTGKMPTNPMDFFSSLSP